MGEQDNEEPDEWLLTLSNWKKHYMLNNDPKKNDLSKLHQALFAGIFFNDYWEGEDRGSRDQSTLEGVDKSVWLLEPESCRPQTIDSNVAAGDEPMVADEDGPRNKQKKDAMLLEADDYSDEIPASFDREGGRSTHPTSGLKTAPVNWRF
ncbi:hypothetical protein NDU88_000749 [Pleurodeles waltl]|uniref:Uncharacterized protein n=1 Tax=Pleurodeles waltl TaxID=8319 RepID=A0AAV7WGD8_PLEWA|nr:hypothetical protein NDU88_000749 [Pleurodeles waltl]